MIALAADAGLDGASQLVVQLGAFGVAFASAFFAYRSRRAQVNLRRLRTLTTDNEELRDDVLALVQWSYDVRTLLAARGIDVPPPPRLRSQDRTHDDDMALLDDPRP